MKRFLWTICVVAAVMAVAVADARPPRVTARTIAGARIHLTIGAYEHVLGKPFTKELDLNSSMPPGWTRLIFPNRRVSVYFAPKNRRASVVTTWNKMYRTAAGIGPCSTVSELKLAYGQLARPSKFNTQRGMVYAYTVGRNLLFATNNTATIGAVALYDGGDPKRSRPGGSLSYAGAIALDERSCQ